MNILIHLDQKHGPGGIRDLLFVSFCEVVFYGDLLARGRDKSMQWVFIEHHIRYQILSQITPVSDYTLACELLSTELLPPLRIAICSLFKLLNTLQAVFGRDKFENRVNN